MKMTGIIMSGNHPKLTLDELKTQTRRTWGLGEINKNPDKWICHGIDNPFGLFVFEDTEGFEPRIKCPYGQVGDRLWVRETWGLPHSKKANQELDEPDIVYKVKSYHKEFEHYGYKWRPSIHMPRWASRILLEITSLRAERLQETTEEDAKAEGAEFNLWYGDTSYNLNNPPHDVAPCYRTGFVKLWDSLNAKRGYGWDANPWVWVISFKVIK